MNRRCAGLAALLLPALALLLPTSAAAQADSARADSARAVVVPVPPSETVGDWDSPAALALVRRAIERHGLPMQRAAGLHDYRADAHGWLYFYLDRENGEEPTLVKIDQIALEVYWAYPGLTKQRIVGRRGADPLPNRMRYHLDHLTVVQNEFGRSIRLGDGDEVQAVPHPASPGALSIYHFRIADSTSLYLPGATGPVRVYEVQVRPRDASVPGIVGALYLDRESADIVRMAFTFTPSSYVDRRLDYIRVSLDNGLWEGRYWLPYEQRVEIRRQVPELDFPLGSVIRGRYRISGYTFNDSIPPSFFNGPRVVAVPDSALRAYPFQEGLYADIQAEGLSADVDLDAVRKEARHIAGQMILSGLPRVRLDLPEGASSALRFDRAEGVYLGAGLAYQVGPRHELRSAFGYAFAPDRPHLSLALGPAGAGVSRLSARAFLNDFRDLGDRPALPGALNTVSAAFLGEDWLDPYYASGAELNGRTGIGGWTLTGRMGLERQRSATLARAGSLLHDSAGFRPVLPVTPGWLAEVSAGLDRHFDLGRRLDLVLGAAVEAGHIESDEYVRPHLSAGIRRPLRGSSFGLDLQGEAGASLGSPPQQRFFLLGGPGTLPGYDYRAFAGDRFAQVGLDASLALPLLGDRAAASLHFLGGLGWTGGDVPAQWPVVLTGGVRSYVGAGLGLFSDAGSLDVVRGLDGGRWQLVFRAGRMLWDSL